MSASFEADPHPGRPKVLFVGIGQSSHTLSWIGLLEGAAFNVRLFSVPGSRPPDDWPVRAYVAAYGPNSPTRRRLGTSSLAGRLWRRQLALLRGAIDLETAANEWLAVIVQRWRPDVVHTFGLDAARFYYRARLTHDLASAGRWVLQTRGGSDLALSHLDPGARGEIGALLRACDQIVSDNIQNFRIAREFGVREEQLSRIGTVPGTGGIDIDALARRWHGPTSERRLILWPKAYECPWSKALPVFEALKLCWERMPSCRIEMLAATPDVRDWFWALPEEIRRASRIVERIPRAQVLELMVQARVMLAPSLIDGVPNALYEAMAAGAFPVVSPLETIRPIVEDERNVLFARNLYPEEIASALVRAMTDDSLVDAAAHANLSLVRKVADRAQLRQRVLALYEELSSGPQAASSLRASVSTA